MGTYAWAPHRVLPLDGLDLALLAEESSGWCVLTSSEYDLVSQQLADPSAAALGDGPVWTALHDAGLLTRDGKRHPDAQYQQESFPSVVLLKLTGSCNLDCEYCYDYDPVRFKAQQTFERMQQTLHFLLGQRDRLAVAFHGGEPLLQFDLMRRVVAWLDAEGLLPRVHLSIQTNATRFTPHILDFLEQHHFSVGISLDGATEEANVWRTTRGPVTPLQGFTRLLQERPEFVQDRCGILAVVSRTTAPTLPDFALWLQERGVQGLAVSFLDVTGRGVHLAHERVQPADAAALYAAFVELIRCGALNTLAFRSLISRIGNLYTLQTRDLCLRGPCGAASDFLVLDAQGTLRTCDCVYDPYFEIGSLEELPLAGTSPARQAVLERHAWLRQTGPTCAHCPIFGLCGGTCVAKALARHGQARSVDDIECAVSQYIYPTLLQEYASGGSTPLLHYFEQHRHRPMTHLNDP